MKEKLIKFLFMVLTVGIGGCSAHSKINIQAIHPRSPLPTTRTIEYESFRDAMRDVDLNYAETHPLLPEGKSFYQALKFILQGEEEAAGRILRSLHHSATDSLLRSDAELLLYMLFFYQSNWQELLTLDSLSSTGSENSDLLLPRAYRTLPKEVYTFHRSSFTLPINFTASGIPTVEVRINGIPKKFLLDTGAGMSVVSSRVAKECQMSILIGQESEAGTSTSIKVKIQPAGIEELTIGDLTINNHPVIIIDQKDLQFKWLGIFTMMKIDGIIGWNAIKNLFIEVDYKSKRITFKKPEWAGNAKMNFFMLGGYPVARLRSEDGIPLNFGVDTGARQSWITEKLLKKMNTAGCQKIMKTIGSAGGKEKIESQVIPELKLIFNDYLLTFHKIGTRPTKLDEFVELDGVLGGDIFENGTIRIDYVNRIFDLYIPDLPLSR